VQLLLLWSICLAVSGIGIMLLGIWMLSLNPSAALPHWVKLLLVVIAALFIVVYGLLLFKLIFVLTEVDNGIMIKEGGIRL